MSNSILMIRDLTISFSGLGHTTDVVRECSLTVSRGEVLGLVGESGSGKSLTALACLGLVPQPGAVSGSIELDGQEVVGRADVDIAGLRGGTAAMIFQNPASALNPFFTVGRQMTDAIGRHHAAKGDAMRDIVCDALTTVRIPDTLAVLGKYPHQMSGGQLQRVMIAMAIACEPALLIADEPTTALDVTVQAQIILLLRELAQKRNLAILFITHDLSVVASLCDRVAVMYAGEVVESGPVKAIFGDPLHPYTRLLMETVPNVGVGQDTLRFIPGQVPNMANRPPGCPFHTRCDVAIEECTRVHPTNRDFGNGRFTACHQASAETTSGLVGRECA